MTSLFDSQEVIEEERPESVGLLRVIVLLLFAVLAIGCTWIYFAPAESPRPELRVVIERSTR